ncbi:ABC-2 type transport system ATP-binding protein [Chitinophaga skermanii]|uniref:ABC-2 type transport system ATP-binding protein n=1 Tax=Chitinophaga skermanii TaxID=331697 RepID=A0A327R3Q3_9BACT|nr:ATP-binding cassette domain-containing protein [Chitinophaga skermanii]RAJ10835.1 ABC-2 type transport system ATP-binding protein [Chitinophaga skermanii]
MENNVLSLHQISKKYGAVQALAGVSFDVPSGSVFGILGPNGSGKTTLLGIIMDVLKADQGTYSWFNEQPHSSLRKRIGTLLETPNFYHYYTAVQNLEITAAIKGHGKQDIDGALQMTGLYERRHSKFSTYSLGMKQRLAIAAALLGDPQILLFDEPTNGLDPAGIAEIRDLIRKLNQLGKTVIMASHLLDEVEKVCTHVAILKKGNLLTAGLVNTVLSNEDIIEVSTDDLAKLESVLTAWPGVKSVQRFHTILQVTFEGEFTTGQVNQYCFEQGIVLSHLSIKKKSLEAKFIELTN